MVDTVMPVAVSETAKRPCERDPEIIAAAVEESRKEIEGWLAEDTDLDDWEEVKSDVCAAVRSSSDGYARAQFLDSKGWSPDSALVEIMDGISCWSAVRDATIKWVAENKIAAAHAVGDRINLHRGYTLSGKPSGGISTGTITDIRADTAEYLVLIDGEPEAGGRSIIRFEFTYPIDQVTT